MNLYLVSVSVPYNSLVLKVIFHKEWVLRRMKEQT